MNSQRKIILVRVGLLSRPFEAPPRPTSQCVQSARKAAAEQRAEHETRQFQQLIAMYRASGTTFRETKASVRKAEETRLKIEQDLEVRRQNVFFADKPCGTGTVTSDRRDISLLRS